MTQFNSADSLGSQTPEEQQKYINLIHSDPHADQWNFFEVTYGSKLYGTSTPTSDTDEKVVYIPSLNSMLLGKKPSIYKHRFDAEGNRIGDGFTMPDNGVETEYFPIQTFVRDFVNGQTYAQEMAFAIYGRGKPAPGITFTYEYGTYKFIKELVENFSNAEVYSMVGFAMKQTFDYVKRGERLIAAQKVLDVVDALAVALPQGARLDTIFPDEAQLPVLDHIAHLAELETEVLTNGKKPQNSLKLNGRNYLESTTVEHLRAQIVKVIQSFGDRSQAAAEQDVDYKSLSHAVRVYQQAIELLDTGRITFPRANAEFLLSVKQGKEDLGSVKSLLISLDDEVKAKMETSTMRKKTPEMQKAAEDWLLVQLKELYDLGD